MMGAAVYPASEQIYFRESAEYLHKMRRLGASHGEFKSTGFPTGEFSYCDMDAAYPEGKEKPSSLNNYSVNTYYCPSMCNLRSEEEKTTYPFRVFSEASERLAVSLAPILVQGLEERGMACAYTHISKGSVPIRHFIEGEAADYFDRKVRDFFFDASRRYPDDDTDVRALIWHQGESDIRHGTDSYVDALRSLWDKCKALGFTHFLIVRVGYWSNSGIADIMKAQELFCNDTPDAFILTRTASYLYHPSQPEGWFGKDPGDEFRNCRDSYFGFPNHHINEKGFHTITRYALPNLIRILWQGDAPLLEEERVSCLVE